MDFPHFFRSDDVQARGVSKVFADGGTRGSTRRDRLKELRLPDIPEIAGKSEGRGADLRPEGTMSTAGRGRRAEPGAFPGPVQLAACRFLNRP
ncbi:MAG: hypothetical protein OXC93_16770 [Rhodospirillaceae bacterium]|nr:hypothetical protein [Rhodospirillaceae bacterium]